MKNLLVCIRAPCRIISQQIATLDKSLKRHTCLNPGHTTCLNAGPCTCTYIYYVALLFTVSCILLGLSTQDHSIYFRARSQGKVNAASVHRQLATSQTDMLNKNVNPDFSEKLMDKGIPALDTGQSAPSRHTLEVKSAREPVIERKTSDVTNAQDRQNDNNPKDKLIEREKINTANIASSDGLEIVLGGINQGSANEIGVKQGNEVLLDKNKNESPLNPNSHINIKSNQNPTKGIDVKQGNGVLPAKNKNESTLTANNQIHKTRTAGLSRTNNRSRYNSIRSNRTVTSANLPPRKVTPNPYMLGKAKVFINGLFDDDIKRMYGTTHGRIWPEVKRTTLDEAAIGHVVPAKFAIVVTTSVQCDILDKAVVRYLQEIKYFGVYAKKLQENRELLPQPNHTHSDLNTLTISVKEGCQYLYPFLHMDESYHLNLKHGVAHLIADTVWGALRGLETFYQLLYVPNPFLGQLHVKMCSIQDSPAYAYRGILMDTARHFLSMNTIFNNLDAMAQNKMNTLHWHIVDDQSFPFKSKEFPDLWKKGAYSYEKTYSFEDISRVIEYARDRGIRVVPEFDSPGHTRAWFGQPGLLTDCGDERVVKTGVFDVTKEETYSFIEKFFSEVISVFKDSTLHIGGDEVSVVCWYKNKEMLKHLANYTHYELLNQYFKRFHEILFKIDNHVNTIVWEEVLKNYQVVLNPNRTVIEVWLDKAVLQKAASQGFQVIYAGCWYLDHVNSERPDWEKYYDCRPEQFFSPRTLAHQLIGGEACMWAEWVDDTNMIQRLWPRASAAAERLWRNPSHGSYGPQVKERMQEQICRMKRRGLPVTLISGPGDCEGRVPYDKASAQPFV